MPRLTIPLLVATVLAAGEDTVHLDIPDLARLRARLAATPLARLWEQPGIPDLLRSLPLERLGLASEALTTLWRQNGSLHLDATNDRDLRLHVQPRLAAAVVAAITTDDTGLCDASNAQATILDNGGPPRPAGPVPAGDLVLRIRDSLGPHADWQLDLAEGWREVLAIQPLPAPLGRIDAAALAGLPGDSVAAFALAIDGAALARLLPRIRASARWGDFCAAYDRCWADLGPLAAFLASLGGTITGSVAPGSPLPRLVVALPAGGGWDALLGRLAAAGGVALPADAALPVQVPFPRGASGIEHLWLSRQDARWRLSLMLASEPAVTPVAPAWAERWSAHGCAAMADVAGLARMAEPYVRMAAAGGRQRVPPWLPGLLRALAATPWRTALAGDGDAEALRLSGDGCLTALLPVLIVAAMAIDPIESAIERERLAAAAEALGQRLRASTAPATLAAPPAGWRYAGPAPWAVVLPPVVPAASDQPVAVVNPAWHGGAIMTADDLGGITAEERARTLPDLLKRTSPGTLPEACWAEALRLGALGRALTSDDAWPWRTAVRDWRFAADAVVADRERHWSLRVPAGWRQLKAPAKPADDVTYQWQVDGCEITMRVSANGFDGEAATAALPAQTMVGLRALNAGIALDRVDSVDIDGQRGSGMTTVLAPTGKAAIGASFAWVARRGLLVFIGVEGPRPAALRLFTECCQRFSFERDPPWVGELAGSRPAAGERVPGSGAALEHARGRWRVPADIAAINQHAGAVVANTVSGTWAMLVGFPQPTPGTPARALLDGALAGIDNAPQGEVTALDPVPTAWGPAHGIQWERPANGERYRLRAHAIDAGGSAMLLLVWANAKVQAPVVAADARALLAALRAHDQAGPAVSSTAAAIQRQVGLALHERKRTADALTWLKSAVALRSEPAVVQDVLQLHANLERWREGLDWYRANAARHADYLDVARYEPWFLLMLEQHAAAAAAYRALFAAGWREAGSFMGWLNALSARSDQAGIAAACRDFAEVAALPAVVRHRATLVAGAGDRAAAVALLQPLAGKDAAAAHQLAQLHLEGEQWSEALAAVEPHLAAPGADAELTMDAAIAQFRLGRAVAARALLEALDARQPGDERVARWLRAVRAELGAGDNRPIARALPPVALPAGVPAPEPAPWPETVPSWCLLLEEERLAWRPGEQHESTRWVVAIADSEACDAFATLRLGLPAGEELYIERLEVRDRAGAVLGRLDRDACFVRDAADDPPSGRRVAHVPVPGLRPGCVLDVTSLRRRGDSPRPRFQGNLFSGRKPVERAAFTVIGDASEIAVRHGPGLARTSGPGWVQVAGERLAGLPGEVCTPDDDDDLAWVRVGDARAQWPALAREYLDLIRPCLAATPAVDALAQEIAGALPAAARPRALAAWVQRNIAYAGVGFGRRAREPRPAGETCERRQGDCKDMAVLLHRLLAAAGIPSHLALVRSGGVIDAALPDLDQFNHMVVVLSAGDRLHVLDPTARHLDPDAVPFALAGRQALVLDDARLRLERLPAVQPTAIRSRRRVRLAGDGTATIDERTQCGGIAAQWLRGIFAGQAEGERPRLLAGTLATTVARVERVAVSGIDDPTADLVLEWTWQPQARAPADATSFAVADPWAEQFLRVERGGPRRRPVEWATPWRIQLNLAATAADGRAMRITLPAAQEAAAMRIAAQADGDGARIAVGCDVLRLPANDWPRLVAGMDAGCTALAPLLKLP